MPCPTCPAPSFGPCSSREAHRGSPGRPCLPSFTTTAPGPATRVRGGGVRSLLSPPFLTEILLMSALPKDPQLPGGGRRPLSFAASLPTTQGRPRDPNTGWGDGLLSEHCKVKATCPALLGYGWRSEALRGTGPVAQQANDRGSLCPRPHAFPPFPVTSPGPFPRLPWAQLPIPALIPALPEHSQEHLQAGMGMGSWQWSHLPLGGRKSAPAPALATWPGPLSSKPQPGKHCPGPGVTFLTQPCQGAQLVKAGRWGGWVGGVLAPRPMVGGIYGNQLPSPAALPSQPQTREAVRVERVGPGGGGRPGKDE